MNADGTGLRLLTDSPVSDGFPSWSPRWQNDRLHFHQGRLLHVGSVGLQDDWRDIGPYHTLYMVNANGSGIREVTDEFAQFVDWSPDGQSRLLPGAEHHPTGWIRTHLPQGGSR